VVLAVFLSASCGGGRDGGAIIRFASSDLVVRPHETYVVLEWSFPNEGDSVRSIEVEVIRDGEAAVHSVGLGATSYRVDDLKEGADYDFRVIFTYEDGSLGWMSKKRVTTGLNTDGDELIDADDDNEDAFPTVFFP